MAETGAIQSKNNNDIGTGLILPTKKKKRPIDVAATIAFDSSMSQVNTSRIDRVKLEDGRLNSVFS